MLLAQTESWSDEVRNGFEGFFDFIPNLIGFIVILIVGYIVARLVAAALRKVLGRSSLDQTVTSGQGGRYVAKATDSPSNLIARIVFWVIMLGALALGASVLGIAEVSAVVGAIFEYIPNVIAAILIFLVAAAIAAGISGLVDRTMGDTPTGKVLGTVGPGLVMAIAIFMILNQLQIAPTIVTITYAGLIGALGLAAALAFGLGGRDVAARMLEDAYDRGQSARDQVRRDLATGRARRGLPSNVDDLTLEELQNEARELDVPGRSTMSKDELAAAVRQERAETVHHGDVQRDAATRELRR